MTLEWTNCFDCVYWEDCTEKESRDGCCFGESLEESIEPLILKLCKDTPEGWQPREFPLHTGEHSQ
jgi:hypothetical protein